MEKTKKTQKELYAEIIANETLTEEQRDFLKGRVELLDKKKGSSNAKKSDEHIEIENSVMEVLENEPNRIFSCSELALILKTSPQKLTPRLKALVEDGKVTVSKEKRTNVYKLAVEG
jgi:DNA-binding transcriptional ArsR family regulator